MQEEEVKRLKRIIYLLVDRILRDGNLDYSNRETFWQQFKIENNIDNPLPNQKGDVEDGELDKIIEEIETSSHVHGRHLLRKLITRGK